MKKIIFACHFLFLICFMCLIYGCASTKTPNTPPTLKPEIVNQIDPSVQITETGFKSYRETFPEKWALGEKIAQEILSDMEKLGTEKSEAIFAVAIIFPELTRYNSSKDFLETALNRTTAGSKNPKDYSIGEMQMTQSFAIDVEKKIAQNAEWQKQFSQIDFRGEQSASAAKKRIARISKRQTQIQYLLAFVKIFTEMYKPQIANWQGNQNIYESKICLAYFATAYNAGFMRDEETLFKYMMRFGFPYGGYDKKSSWNYRSISQDWFEKILKR